MSATFVLAGVTAEARAAAFKQVAKAGITLTEVSLNPPDSFCIYAVAHMQVSAPPVVIDVGRVPLNARELDVLRCVSDGKLNAEIGTYLNVSVDTVKTYVRTVLHKIGATNRTHAVSLAYQLGILGGT